MVHINMPPAHRHAEINTSSIGHNCFTMSCATRFNHVSEANILDDWRTYISLATPRRATISPDKLAISLWRRGSGRRTRSSSAGTMKLVGTEYFSAREIPATGSRQMLRSNTSPWAQYSPSLNLTRWAMARRSTHFPMGIEKLSCQLERKTSVIRHD